MAVQVVHRREYIMRPGRKCIARTMVKSFPSIRQARKFIADCTPYRYRTDEHGNFVCDSRAKLAH